MTELKTLIDFRCKCVSCTGNIEQDCISDETLVSMQELKQEAIKWFKRLEELDGTHYHNNQDDFERNFQENPVVVLRFIEHFFNIEESDLK